jgi:hypothetical protein
LGWGFCMGFIASQNCSKMLFDLLLTQRDLDHAFSSSFLTSRTTSSLSIPARWDLRLFGGFILASLRSALEGDMTAMKLCIERILPPLKEPMEPTKVQHAIEVVLKELKWLTASADMKTIEHFSFEKELTNADEQP